jgi:hypothetical protein
MENEMEEECALQIEYDVSKKFYHQPITATNCNIIHALTGEVTPYKIGTRDEYLFYVVMESDPNHPKDPRRLYFNSPLEYENASGNVVPPQCKERFKQNRLLYNQ